MKLKFSRLALLLLITLTVLPVLAVTLYALAERWDRSLWPEVATLRWLLAVGQNGRVHAAVGNTLVLSLCSALLALVLGGGASLVAQLTRPRLVSLLDTLALLPYAIPPVVVAISKLFQDYPTAPQQAANG